MSFPEFVASPMINYYRLHPNYYYKLTYGSIRIQGHGFGTLNVCYSRYVELPRYIYFGGYHVISKLFLIQPFA